LRPRRKGKKENGKQAGNEINQKSRESFRFHLRPSFMEDFGFFIRTPKSGRTEQQAGKNNLTLTFSNLFVNKKRKNINMIKGVYRTKRNKMVTREI
jgi:hypothetical protein